MSYQNIIDRLTAAKDAYEAVHMAARRAGEPQQGNPAYNDVGDEYRRAWDAAGIIWDAAFEAEEVSDMEEAARLWGLLAPFDDEAASRGTIASDTAKAVMDILR
jgi:hypothetical protein